MNERTGPCTVRFIQPWELYGIGDVITPDPWDIGHQLVLRGYAEYVEPEKPQPKKAKLII